MKSAWLRRLLAVALIVPVAALVAACGDDDDSASGGGDTAGADTAATGDAAAVGDITALCGDEDLTVGYLKSVGGNSWVTQSAAEFEDEAAKCPNLESEFAEAINDQQKAISDINSFVAQGGEVMVIFPDYGPPELPAIRKATDAGVTVVTVGGDAGGEAGVDFVDTVDFGTEFVAGQWADFLNEQLPDGGKVTFLGGTPGAATSIAFFGSLKAALEKYPNLELVPDRINDTNWDPAKKRQVMTALLAEHGRIDAVVTDFNGTDTGIIPAYQAAGFEPPVMASITPNNAIGCQWQETPYPLLTMGGTSSITRIALRIGLADRNEIPYEESNLMEPEPLKFVPGGEEMPCDPSFPPDADLTADLTQEQLTELFQ